MQFLGVSDLDGSPLINQTVRMPSLDSLVGMGKLRLALQGPVAGIGRVRMTWGELKAQSKALSK